METQQDIRDSGISFLGPVEWGAHLGLFYKTKEDLLEILVPFFSAGLKHNEKCLWVTTEFLRAEDAKSALRKAIPDLKELFEKGQLHIISYKAWYIGQGKFDINKVFNSWIKIYEEALKEGFDGLRCTGDTYWVEKKDWQELIKYERTVKDALRGVKIISLCCYPLEKSTVGEVIDIIDIHEKSILIQDGLWRVIQSIYLKRTKEEVRALKIETQGLQTQYRRLVDNLPCIVCWVDPEGGFVMVNPAVEELTGFSREEWLGDPDFWYSRIHPEEREEIKKSFSAACQKRQAWNVEYRFLDKQGNERWFLHYAVPAVGREGEFKFMDGVIFDITKRKHAEEALFESQRKYVTFINNLPLGVYRNTPGPQGSFLEANPAIVKMFEADSREEFLRHTVSDLYQDKTKRQEFSERLLEQGFVKDVELELVTLKGRKIWASVSAVVKKDEKGNVCFDGIIEDITERKMLEEALRASGERYKGVVDNIGIGVALISPHMEILTLNNQMREWFPDIDVSKRPICYRSFNVPAREGICEYCPTCKTLQDGEVHEAVTATPAGDKIINYRIISSPIRDEAGNITAAIEMVEDITERRRAEEALKTSQEKYHSLVDNIPGMVYRGEKDWSVFFIGAWVSKISGYTPSSFISKEVNWLDLIHPYDKERILDESRVLNSRPCSIIQEYRIIRKDGSIAWVRDIKKSLFEGGEFAGVDGIVFDITEQKLAQEALQESEERFRTLISNIPGAVYRCACDKDWTVEFVSAAIEEISGYHASDFVNNQVRTYASIIHPQDRLMVENVVFEAVRQNRPYTIEYRIMHADGNIRWVYEKGRGVLGKNDEVLWLDGAIFDITLRKLLEERYRFLFDHANDAIFIADAESGEIIDCNRQAEVLLVRSREEIIGEHQTFLHPPEKSHHYRNRFLDSAEKKNAINIDAEVITKEGKIIPVVINTSVMEIEGRRIMEGIFHRVKTGKKKEDAAG